MTTASPGSAPARDAGMPKPTEAPNASAAAAARPTRAIQIVNLLVFQAAWFAAVLGAAHHMPVWGSACVIAALGWHLGVSARPAQEAALIGCLCLIGLVIESAIVQQGHVRYPSGQPDPRLAPYWIVALWGLLAMAPNVTMRWLKHRPWLAAVLGAVLGPVSFASGARLGGASFIDASAALATLACTWAIAMPAVMWLSNRFDGVAVPQVAHG